MNRWYFWPITIGTAVVLVVSMGLVVQLTVGRTDGTLMLAAFVLGGAALCIGGLSLGSWLAYRIADREQVADSWRCPYCYTEVIVGGPTEWVQAGISNEASRHLATHRNKKEKS